MKNRVLVILLAVVVLRASVAAEHWPQWRGPLLNGISGEKSLPTRWSTTENITWKLAVLGGSGAAPRGLGGRPRFPERRRG
jgi:outer membrane protein assembly factor BamB